ncbi:3-deoxy-7-phosphoheptulonate synthase [Clostridium sp. DL1XJH146]
MIIVIKPGTSKEKIENFTKVIREKGLQIHESQGEEYFIMGLVGDTSRINDKQLAANEFVEKVIHVQEPYKKANRIFHPADTIVKVRDTQIGGGTLSVMAGPCSVENEEQILEIARKVKQSGATFLRGGAFKPRTSPYSFQGLGLDGLELLKIAREETGLPIVTEIMSADMVGNFVEDVDVIQVGARNMQNFALLKELGSTNKPILLKRGLSATIEEFLMSAEYIMSKGNENVILCERGIRTFENYTRNTLDLSAVPAIKKLSHLPIIIDPSHACGMWWMVESLARAAVAVGADGLMIEVHNDPVNAFSDGQQSIKPEKFDTLMKSIKEIHAILNK